MGWMRRLGNLFGRKRLDRELDDELRFHLQMRAKDLRDQGISKEEAERAARRAFGNVLRMREDARSTWGIALVESFGQDIRYAARMLRKTRLLSMVGSLSLALGIGVSLAIWTLFNGVLFTPPPLYEDPEELVTVWETPPKEPGELRPVSGPTYLALKQRERVFREVAAVRVLSGVSARLEDYPVAVRAKAITPNLLSVLGVRPAAGRGFRADEAGRVVILGNSFLRRQFEGSEDALGTSILVDGEDHTVIGVMPRRFWFEGTDTDLWLPLRDGVESLESNERVLLTAARLNDGVSLAQSRTQLAGILAQVIEEHPDREEGWGLRMEDLVGARLLRTDVPPGVALLAGMVWAGMLIACVNIANVIVGRSIDRGRETVVRAALGAGRGRLARQFLTESLLLVMVGGVLSAPVAWASLQLVFAKGVPDFPVYYDFPFDARVAGFLIGVVLVTGIGAGLAPALARSKANLNNVLKQSSRTLSTQRQTLRRTLVIAEIGLTLALVIVAGGLWVNYHELLERSPGFEYRDLVSVRLTLAEEKYQTADEVVRFVEEATELLRTAPGVSGAAAIGAPEFWDGARNIHSFQIADAAEAQVLKAPCNPVSVMYFEALGIPVVRGRPIGAHDDERAPRVLWINETMARRYWKGADPVGSVVRLEDASGSSWMVAGVVGDTLNRSIMGKTVPAMYVPYRQYPRNWKSGLLRPTVLLRTRVDMERLAPMVRSTMATLDPDQAVVGIARLESHVHGAASEVLLGVLLPGPLIGLGLLLSALGVYGVLAFAISRRTHEIGIRMALGARSERLVGMLLGEGLRLTVGGVALGMILGYVFTRQFAGPLESAGLGVFAAAACLLLLVGIAASYVPALKAVRVEPSTALRYE